MPLTLSDVKNAKPAQKPYKITDTKGLYLVVSPAGGKTWRLKYRFGFKEKLLTLGRFPELTLVAARTAAEDARRLVLSGKDPVFEAQKEKAVRLAASEATFRKMAEEWYEDNKDGWSPSNAARVHHRLTRDLYPLFGHIPIGSIESTTILRALRKIEGRGSIETAKRVRVYIRSIFKRAKGERLVSAEMMLEIDELADALKPARKGKRQPALTNLPDLLTFQQAVDKSVGGKLSKLASRLLALTAVRVGVLRTAIWSEFHGIDWNDPDAVPVQPIWRIPAARMKLEVEDKENPAFAHEVLLSRQAVDVLRVLRTMTGTSTYVFPSSRSWHAPMSDSALSTLYKRMADGRYKGCMVPHGWRSAFSTIMNERAADLERDTDRMLIDMILAHVPAGMSASEWAYNRARYVKPRAALYQAWADMVSEGMDHPSKFLSGGRR